MQGVLASQFVIIIVAVYEETCYFFAVYYCFFWFCELRIKWHKDEIQVRNSLFYIPLLSVFLSGFLEWLFLLYKKPFYKILRYCDGQNVKKLLVLHQINWFELRNLKKVIKHLSPIIFCYFRYFLLSIVCHMSISSFQVQNVGISLLSKVGQIEILF